MDLAPYANCAGLDPHRRERGVTQRKLAAEIGRDFTTVSQYETGRCAPSLEALATIADVLGAPVTAFIKAAA